MPRRTTLTEFAAMTYAGGTFADMIHEGWLTPVSFYTPEIPLAVSLWPDAVAMYKKHAAGKKALVFCANQQQVDKALHHFLDAGIAAAALIAADGLGKRTATLEGFASGAYQVLIGATMLLDLGNDPSIQVVIMAAPTTSRACFEVMVAAAMRPQFAEGMTPAEADHRRASIGVSGKPKAIILDFAGNCQHMGIDNFTKRTPTPDTHLTIPGSLEWDQAPAAAAPDTTDAQPYPVAEYEPGQWWLAEIEKCGRTREVTHDTVRACGIVGNFAAAAFAELAALRDELATAKRANYNAEVALKAAYETQELWKGRTTNLTQTNADLQQRLTNAQITELALTGQLADRKRKHLRSCQIAIGKSQLAKERLAELILLREGAELDAKGIQFEQRRVQSLQQRLTTAEQRNAVLEKNAARYIWLRDKSESVHPFYLSTPIWFTGVKFNQESVDSTIDAAMTNPTEPKVCIECEQPYCHGVCVERGDDKEPRE